MNFFESVRTALKAIWINKMRSLLTMLGIIIGIASVIAVVALGNGTENAIGKEFEAFGTRKVIIYMNWDSDVLAKDILNHEDVEVIDSVFEDELDALSISRSSNGTVQSNSNRNKTYDVSLTGVDADNNKIDVLEMLHGRYLRENEIESSRPTLVISDKMATAVFGRTDVVGEDVFIEAQSQSISYNIVGVYKQTDSLFGGMGSQSYTAYTPYTHVEKITNTGDFVYMLQGTVSEDYDAKEVLDKMITVVERRHNNENMEKYSSFLPESELESINNVMGILTGVISAIAGISLLVGGIGVMNIMLVSVTERTREIGIRKALGATHKEILNQFLIESIIISLIGGILGTVFGIGIAKLISGFANLDASADMLTIFIAWSFSALVGVVFGLLPANKAAKLNPIDALRYE